MFDRHYLNIDFIPLFLVLSANSLTDKQGRFVGLNIDPFPGEGSEIWMEVDLRSNRPKDRTLRFFINRVQQRNFFYNLPPSIKFGIGMHAKHDSVRFLSLDELTSPIHQVRSLDYSYSFSGDE